METKTKANSILEKKLEELEYLVENFGFHDDDLNAYREIQLRLIFTKTLLSTEIMSSQDGGEEEMLKLGCMAKRLTEIEEAFEKQLTGPINEPGLLILESGGGGGDETGSVCSLVELVPEEIEDVALEEKVEDVMAERKIERIQKNRFRGLVSFGIVGFIAGMVSFFGYLCDQMNKESNFPAPT